MPRYVSHRASLKNTRSPSNSLNRILTHTSPSTFSINCYYHNPLFLTQRTLLSSLTSNFLFERKYKANPHLTFTKKSIKILLSADNFCSNSSKQLSHVSILPNLFPKLKNIYSFTTYTDKFTSSSIASIARFLKSFKNLKVYELFSNSIFDKNFLLLSSCSQKYSQLIKLKLVINDFKCDGIDRQILKHTNLKNLGIFIVSSCDSNLLPLLTLCIEKLPYLEILSVNFGYSDWLALTPPPVEAFFRTLSSSKITSLSLNFYAQNLHLDTQKCLPDLLSQCKKLKLLKLALSNEISKDLSSRRLYSKNFTHMPALTNLDLNFCLSGLDELEPQLPPEMLQLTNIGCFEEVKIEFDYASIDFDDDNSDSLGKLLPISWKSIKKLCVQASLRNVKGLAVFCTSLEATLENISDLESISLDISLDGDILLQSFIDMMSTIALEFGLRIHRISLYLPRTANNDANFTLLSYFLALLPNIQSLSLKALCLFQLDELTEVGLLGLAKAIGEMKKLEGLTLQLGRSSYHFKDKDFLSNSFLKSLLQSEKLTVLKLWLQNFKDFIDYKFWKVLVSKIVRIPKIRKLVVLLAQERLVKRSELMLYRQVFEMHSGAKCVNQLIVSSKNRQSKEHLSMGIVIDSLGKLFSIARELPN